MARRYLIEELRGITQVVTNQYFQNFAISLRYNPVTTTYIPTETDPTYKRIIYI